MSYEREFELGRFCILNWSPGSRWLAGPRIFYRCTICDSVIPSMGDDASCKCYNIFCEASAGRAGARNSASVQMLGRIVQTQTRGTGDCIYAIENSPEILLPENCGFAGNPTQGILHIGAAVERIGPATGRLLAPEGTPFPQRSMPGLEAPSTPYAIVQPVPGVLKGLTAPAYGQPGGGIQYILPKPLQWYIDNGFIRRGKYPVSYEGESSEGQFRILKWSPGSWWPTGPRIYYKCTICGSVIPSTVDASCRCYNVLSDASAGRAGANDETSVQILERIV